MALFLQRCFDALANGIIYGSIALALVIVYRATGMLNVAQGEMATVSCYVGLVLHTPATPALAGTGLVASLIPFAPLPLWASLMGALLAGALLGAVVERVVIRRVSQRSGFAVISVTVGVLLVLNGLSEQTWRPVTRGFPSLFPNDPGDYLPIGDARLRYQALGTFLTIMVVLIVLAVLLKKTRLGLAFRAVSSNRDSSELAGIRSGQITTVGWALAGAIGGLAACLVAPTVLLEPNMMVRVLIYSLVAATLGGLDSLGGAVLGGLLIGIAQTMVAGYVAFMGAQLSLPGALALMVLVLLFRPSGLFGTRRIERV
ncbi:MAG: branched-chain amino acid ABC transporter permease [Acidimicrobiia bacterium]